MIHISKRSEYGLHFLVALARRPTKEPLSIHTAAEQLKLPYRFLSQIASSFKKHKLVHSKEGIKGGYTLAVPADEITLKTIVETLDGPIGVVDCLIHKRCGREVGCQFKEVFADVSAGMTKLLNQYRVSDFIKA